MRCYLYHQGTPQVMENYVDSKRDVDGQLKKICEEFIHHVSDLMTDPLKTFLSRVRYYFRILPSTAMPNHIVNNVLNIPLVLTSLSVLIHTLVLLRLLKKKFSKI